MSTPVPPRGPRRGRQTPPRGRQAAFQKKRRQQQLVFGGVGLVVVLIVGLVLYSTLGKGSSTKASADPSAPGSLVAQITGVTPAAMATQANADKVTYPTATNGPTLTAGGKPKVVYIGGEFCPYCAGERWAMVMALSKFGTFSGLKEVTSSASDTVASVPSFSFYGSTYSSPYVAFESSETETVARTKLETPSVADQALLAKYDSGGSIPFVDIGGRWTIVGASYVNTAMQTLSHAEVAQAAATAGTKYGADIQSTAGMIVSRICNLTGGKPGNVCQSFPSVIGG